MDKVWYSITCLKNGKQALAVNSQLLQHYLQKGYKGVSRWMHGVSQKLQRQTQ